MRLRSAGPGGLLVLAAAILLALGSATLAILWINKQAGEEDVLARVRGPLAADDPQVVSLLQRAYLHTPSSLPYNLSTDPAYMRVKQVGTWHFIHKNIDLLFSGQRGGFFVEAGALDGERNSNTLWLEQNLGWTGLLIEPNPSSYQKLRWKQRKAWSSNTCLSPHPYPQEIVLVSMARKKDKYGMNKALESVLSYRGASHLLGYDLETRKFDYVLLQSDQSYLVTQCFPLASYLLALNTTTVHLLSLDVQGVELNVLQNVPWETLDIRTIVVEVVNFDTFKDKFLVFLEEKNYTLFAQGEMDYVFVKNVTVGKQ